MDTAQDRQQEEITVLKSIYEGNFLEAPAPTAWASAARLPEFTIRVVHPTNDKISFCLNVKFPKSYPTLSHPIFTIQKPIEGLTSEQVNTLSHNIIVEAQKSKGEEMVFQIVDYCQDWMDRRIKPKVEGPGSLALEMNQRALDEERARAHQAHLLAAHQAQLDLQKQAQFEEEAMRQLAAREQQYRARKRANSEATERAEGDTDTYGTGGGGYREGGTEGGDTMIETFGTEVKVGEVRFCSVKLFHPRRECLGTVYMADPICDDINASLPLELYVVNFYSSYYSTSQGRKKLKQLESEILRLTTIRDANLSSVYAVKLTLPHSSSSGPSQLMILSEPMPSLTLQDVLEDVEWLREDRARDYLGQILSGLNAIHANDLVHRGITARCIGLSSSNQTHPSQSKVIKLGRISYPTRLLDLHRSNPFGDNIPPVPASEEPSSSLSTQASTSTTFTSSTFASSSSTQQFPDGWVWRDVKNESALVYSRQRDIHGVGIVLMQMVSGLRVMEVWGSVGEAIEHSNVSSSLLRIAMNMFHPTKKNPNTCLSILASLSESSLHFSSTSGKSSTSGHSNTNGNGVTHAGNGLTTNYYQNNQRSLGSAAVMINGATPRSPRIFAQGSPESTAGSYFPRTSTASSRWKEDWEELELLGKGAFGSVVKARNRIDGRIYAVKKVRLKKPGSDTKIFREVTALSRLNHRFIVRYFTTWVENSNESAYIAASDESDQDDSTTDGATSVPSSTPSEHYLPQNGAGIKINFDDFEDTTSRSLSSKSSFPSIHFGASSSGDGSSGSEGSGIEEDGLGTGMSGIEGMSLMNGGFEGMMTTPKAPSPVPAPRTLYIQMEFVERQTLKERIDEGISEDEAWGLFQQIVDALVYMSSMSILHRDIKLTNIFIDAKGDCKVGDFGLATTSLATVDPSEALMLNSPLEPDMTLEVGTRLYIAPEVQSRKRGPRNHNKADMYSLGIVFFEMNYRFATGAERIAVIEDLRKPGIFFPPGWDPLRTRQREIITWLLQHRPEDRPTSLELSQSPLLPQRLEDEYFKGALNLMTKTDSPHHQAVLSSLFTQPPKPSRGYIYDSEMDVPEHAALNDIVQERFAAIFKLHGAVDMEPPLIMPLMDIEDEKKKAAFIDRHGDLVMLPNNMFEPFARLAARAGIKRIKRFHIDNIYEPNPVAGHPGVNKAAILDIITPDLLHGPIAASAELVSLANDVLNSFPNLAGSYEIHISHSKIVDTILNRLPSGHKEGVIDIMTQTKSSLSQKRALLLKRGLFRSTADELELLSEIDEDIDLFAHRLEKLSPGLANLIQPLIQEVKETTEYAKAARVTRPILFHPLMLGSHLQHFKDGIIVEVVRRNKRSDVLATGGRYDHLITKHSFKNAGAPVCAMGIQFNVKRVTVALASFQSSSVKALVKEERSFGYWSPRRCDVYVVSYHPGYLQDRLEVVSYLWQHGIDADLMYESGLPEHEHESHVDMCMREGILFTVSVKPRTGRREQPPFRIKSILKGSEIDVTRQELVSWLQHEIAEQKRVDATTSGAPALSTVTSTPQLAKDVPSSTDVQLMLPTDTKKQRKHVKQLFLDRAFETSVELKSAVTNGLPTIAVDVPPAVFDAMAKNSSWITDEEPWKAILSLFPVGQTGYANQVREAAAKRKSEGHRFVILFAVREERVQLLTLTHNLRDGTN